MEAMERELESGQDYLEMELGQNREELEKFKDKFRRYEEANKRGRDASHCRCPQLLWTGCCVDCRLSASTERCIPMH